MDKKSASSPSLMSRRAFVAGAAASAAMSPVFVRAASYGHVERAVLHLATRSSQSAHVHTFALTAEGCELLGSTAIDSFAAFAAHPALPVLYVARDCNQWQNLPRGVIETYAVGCSMHPLRLLSQTPMALSATGPRSIAVGPGGRHLLVSASTGGAWNAFSLDGDGIPDSVAMSRKETGHAANSETIALPTPHGLTFSPHGLFALGTDPGSRRMTLLRPSPAGIEVLTRWETTNGLAPLAPAWTADGRYIIAANAPTASLSVYEIRTVPENKAGIHLLGNVQTTTPIRALLAHPSEPAVFTSRPQGAGSRVEVWKLHGSHLRLAGDTWISGDVAALAQRFGYLWAASDGRLTRISMRDFRDVRSYAAQVHGTQAIIIQNVVTHRFTSV
jgi:6-phosphogluconolactonase (cycloisomerase 2 family)